MDQEEVVLCGSSAYTKKYYLNDDFEAFSFLKEFPRASKMN